MKTTKLWTIIVILLVAVNCIVLVIVWKKGRPGPPFGKQAPAGEFIISQLKLRPGQIEKFDVMRRGHHQAVEEINSKIKILKDSLFDKLSMPQTNQKTIDSLTSKIGFEYALADKTTYNHFRELRTILNTEQQHKFDQIIQQVLQMVNRPMPPGGGGPEGNRPPNGEGPPPPPGDQNRAPGPLPGNEPASGN